MQTLSYSRPATEQPHTAIIMSEKKWRDILIIDAADIAGVVLLGRIDYRLNNKPLALCCPGQMVSLRFADLVDILQKRLCELTGEECQRAGFENWSAVASDLFGGKDWFEDEERRAVVTLVRFENIRDSLEI